MSIPTHIESRQNAKIKRVSGLKEAKYRAAHGQFIVEGKHEISIALHYGYPIVEVYTLGHLLDDLRRVLGEKIDSVAVYSVTKSIMEKLSMRQNPDGFLAVCAQKPKRGIQDLQPDMVEPLLVLEQIEKPGNLGAIIRSASAFGFQRIILSGSNLDAYHPNVIRNSRGHALGVSLYHAANDELLDWLRRAGYETYIASPEAENDVGLQKFDRNSAIIMGTEHEGVSCWWRENADKTLKIPMKGDVDSLNVSVSASIVLYEVFKQIR